MPLSDIARNYVGTPFLHQGRVPGSGLDCVGTLVCSAKEDGYYIEDYFAYGRDSDPEELIKRISIYCMRVEPIEAAQVDDILVFWVGVEGKPQHLAIKSSMGMIHAYAQKSGGGRVREEPISGFWHKRIHSVWRLKK